MLISNGFFLLRSIVAEGSSSEDDKDEEGAAVVVAEAGSDRLLDSNGCLGGRDASNIGVIGADDEERGRASGEDGIGVD